MKKWDEIIFHDTFRYIDHTEIVSFLDKPYNALTSFAIDDAIATAVSEGDSPPVFRLWSHPKTVVLGIPDGRLPFFEEAVAYLRKHNYEVIIRNSGGLAVVLDESVLNLSLVIPGVKEISIHDAYDVMVHFVQHMFRDLTDRIEAYEIVGSYCPGDYDLSIDGRKFAGISQRRIKDAAAIQIYLDVAGNSFERAEHIRTFYELGINGEQTTFTYPEIVPEVMGSLSDLLDYPLTVKDVKQRVYDTLESFSEKIIAKDFSDLEKKTFVKRYDQMIKRNEKLSGGGKR